MLRKLILNVYGAVVDTIFPPPPETEGLYPEDDDTPAPVSPSPVEVGFPLQKHIDAGKLPGLAEDWERLALKEPLSGETLPRIRPIPFGLAREYDPLRDWSDNARWDRAMVGFVDLPPMDLTRVQLKVGDEFVDAEGNPVATVEHPVEIYLGGAAYVDVRWVGAPGIGRHVMRLKHAPFVGVGKHVDALEVLVMDEAQGRIRPMFARAVRVAMLRKSARSEFFVDSIVRAQRPPDGHDGMRPGVNATGALDDEDDWVNE